VCRHPKSSFRRRADVRLGAVAGNRTTASIGKTVQPSDFRAVGLGFRRRGPNVDELQEQETSVRRQLKTLLGSNDEPQMHAGHRTRPHPTRRRTRHGEAHGRLRQRLDKPTRLKLIPRPHATPSHHP
jgi:hypothetical protein